MNERMRICPECKRASSTYYQVCGCGHQFNGTEQFIETTPAPPAAPTTVSAPRAPAPPTPPAIVQAPPASGRAPYPDGSQFGASPVPRPAAAQAADGQLKTCPLCFRARALSAQSCSCGYQFSPAQPTISPLVEPLRVDALGGLAVLLLLGGIGVAVYYFCFFDVTVVTQPIEFMGRWIGGGDRINNIGLMADRQNGLIAGCASAVIGAILLVAGRQRGGGPW